MISSIRGEVLSAGAGWVVIGVGGMGFRIEVTGRLAGAHAGEQLMLQTQLIVREDSLTLYGFAEADELEVFGILLGVSGVGPRSALGVLSELTPAEVARAAMLEDEKPFKKVSGIGPKTAKLIAVQLAGKLQHLTLGSSSDTTGPSADEAGSGVAQVAATVEQGLLGLGYAEAQAHESVRDAIEAGAPTDEAGLLRAALLLLQSPRVGARGATSNGARR